MSTKELWEKIISRKVMLTISIEQRMIGVYSLRGGEQKESKRENLDLHIVVGREYIDLVQWRNLECMEYLLNWFNGFRDWDYHPTSLHWVCVRDQNAIEVVQCSPKQFWKFRGSQCNELIPFRSRQIQSHQYICLHGKANHFSRRFVQHMYLWRDKFLKISPIWVRSDKMSATQILQRM